MIHHRFFPCLVAALLILGAPHAARADMVDDCVQEADIDLSIGGCTAAIRSGNWTGADLSWAYYNRANAYARIGEHQRAIDDYSQALNLNPEDADAYYNRGNSHRDTDQIDRAMEDFSSAIRLRPDFAHAYGNRARLHRQAGDYELALADYELALLYDPLNANDFNGRGYLYDEMGRYDDAIRDFTEAIRLDPGMGSAYLNRGVTYERMSRYVEAIADWERSIELDGPERVKSWQRYLKDQGGLYQGEIDGVYGPSTRAALIACVYDPNC